MKYQENGSNAVVGFFGGGDFFVVWLVFICFLIEVKEEQEKMYCCNVSQLSGEISLQLQCLQVCVCVGDYMWKEK